MQEAGLQKGVTLAGIGRSRSRAPAVAGGGRQGAPGRREFGRREVDKARANMREARAKLRKVEKAGMEDAGKDKVGMGKEKAAEVGKSAVAGVVVAGGRL